MRTRALERSDLACMLALNTDAEDKFLEVGVGVEHPHMQVARPTLCHFMCIQLLGQCIIPYEIYHLINCIHYLLYFLSNFMLTLY